MNFAKLRHILWPILQNPSKSNTLLINKWKNEDSKIGIFLQIGKMIKKSRIDKSR